MRLMPEVILRSNNHNKDNLVMVTDDGVCDEMVTGGNTNASPSDEDD